MELLVVLTVIALISVLATPLFQRALPGFELKAAAEALRDDFRAARGAAIRDNRDRVVTIDVARGTWTHGDAVATVPRGVSLALLAAESERTGGSAGRIRFHPDGTSTGGRVRMVREDLAYDVTVDWFDGGVTIDDAPAK